MPQHAAERGRHDEFHARRPFRRRAVVVDGRSLDAGDRWRADVHGRNPGAGREPGGRNPHRPRQLAHGAPALCDAAGRLRAGDRRLHAVAQAGAAPRRAAVPAVLRPHHADFALRRRDQGRDALDLGRAVSMQPSEFLKPTFAIFAAWMFSLKMSEQRVPGNLIAIAVFGLVVFVLLKQPDLGMTAVITATSFAQFFVAGLPFIWVILFAGLGIGGVVGAYLMFFHVRERVDQFLKGTGDSFQIDRALEAFQNGGLTGRGPGEGSVKMVLPDAHSDFIFAVAAEEFGLIVCLLLVSCFAFIVLRALSRMVSEHNMFVLLGVTGLATGFGLQAVINMASSLHLMPTKGMTLPFISYGGSSIIAIALGVGMLLALTRKRFPGSLDT